MALKRRTPLFALILAPFALLALVLAWEHALLPLFTSAWRSEVVVQVRLASDDAGTRSKALRDAVSVQPPSEALIGRLVEVIRADPAPAVRAEAALALGAMGNRRALPAVAIQILEATVLEGKDDALLSAAVKAVGQAAAQNRIAEKVVQRIVRSFDERHLEWVYPSAAEALGAIGAVQALPGEVHAAMLALFMNTGRPGERENLARAFVQIAATQTLPAPTLDELAAALESDRNDRIRAHALYALAHASAYYPRSKQLVMAATRDSHAQVSAAAMHGLHLIETKPLYADRGPMSVALDRSLPVEARLKAFGALTANRRDAVWREQVLMLARDEDPRIAAAALELFMHIGGAPEEEFDRRSLIPQLTASMSHPDPQVRRAAFGALGRAFVHNPRYRSRAADFRTQLEAGAQDSDAIVRINALVALLRGDPGTAEREAILKRGLIDADPHVRRVVVSWLGSPQTETGIRQVLLDQALKDPDAGVRQAAAEAGQQWRSQKRGWLVELWRLWRAGEHARVGLALLTAVTVAAPVLVGGVFFLYFMARLLTYVYQRRWRALVVVPVIAAWTAASYGMFLLYFMAAHMRSADPWNALQIAGVLWIAVAFYAGAGWGLHYAVRR
jgi:HEAT repeat protein